MAQSVLHLLSQVRGGAALERANERCDELVAAVMATGKEGEVHIIIKIKPEKTDETVVRVVPSVKAKIPERPFAEGIFFVTDDNKLVREDPRQIEMELERKAKLEAQGATAINQVGRGVY